MACERTELAAFYRRYIDRCNEHRFDELGEFVDQNVEVNGAVHGLQKYQAGLRSVVDMFPNSSGIYNTSLSTTAGSART